MFYILFCSILLAGPSILGQKQEITDPKQHEVSVTLKLIQVYVSNKDGNPVHDLSKEDFILYDNGRIMTLTEFEAHRADPEPKSENFPKDFPRINRKFFLLLDAYRNDAPGLKKARTTALHFINTQVQATDELGLLSYSIGKGLVIHKPLTTAHDKIRESINAVKLFPSITTWDRGATAMDEAVDFTDSLNDFSVSLRYIPGYKHIILFSAGLPRSLFESDDPRLRFEHERLAKELASSSTHIYTVDTQGTRDLIEGREQKGDDSLRRLSDLTGGHHFPNVDYRDAISQGIQNATGNYYVLGYYAGEALDGKYHEIKVNVERKGIKIQAQKGYFNPKTFSKLSKLEKRHHLLDLARNPSPHFGIPKEMPSFSRIWWDSNSLTVLHLTEIVPSDLEEILAEKIEFFTLVYNEEGVLIAEGKKDMDYTKDPPEQICIYNSILQPPVKLFQINDINTEQDNTLVLELELTPVPPGEYVLELSVSGTALGTNTIFTQNVIIR